MIEKTLQYKRTFVSQEVSFDAAATESTKLDCGGMQVMGLIIPTTWTTGNISFDVQETPTSASRALHLFDGTELNELIIPEVSASKWIPLVPYWFASVPFLKIKCSVAQAAATTIHVVLQPLFQGIHG